MIEIPLTRGHVAIIDDEDRQLALMRWYAKVDGDAGVYAVRGCFHEGGKRGTMFLHHAVAGRPPEGFETDHINGNTLDCRRENLRNVTRSENRRNRKGSQGGPPFLGVTWAKDRGKYQAQIKHKGKTIYLGRYDTAEEANEARLKAEKELWGIQPRRAEAHKNPRNP